MNDLIERLHDHGKYKAADFRMIVREAADALETKDQRIKRLEGDLQVTRLQRDARVVSEFVVDEAVKAEIERLRAVLDAEARNRVRILDEQEAEIERLEAVVDAAREIVEGPHKNWPKLHDALAALEDK
jgi:hypothetical protein